MKLIAGLGNPGAEYKNSRHNIGFDVLDLLAHKWGLEYKKQKFNARYASGSVGFDSIVLLKPQTYMNRSGFSIAQAVQFYNVALEDILVVVDDMALPLGQIRLRAKGSAGGHNGLKDIILSLSSNEFARLKVGIGQSRGSNVVGHVLGYFSQQERELLEPCMVRSLEAVCCWLDKGINIAMNTYNAVDKPDKELEDK